MIAHTLTVEEGHAVVLVLRSLHIPVTVTVVDGTAHVRPGRAVSTGEGVLVLRAFAAVTDSVQYHAWPAADPAGS